MTPVEQRMSAVGQSPQGIISPSGVDQYKQTVKQNPKAFIEWRRSPVTRKVLAALQDAIIHSPSGQMASSDIAVQYGVTQGLTFAAQLIADPSTLWPDVLVPDGKTQVPELPVMDYNSTLDDIFNS